MSTICQVTNDVPVVSLNSPTFDAREFFEVKCRIQGYSAASVARLRFNGDTGTTNYSFSVIEGNGTPSTGQAGTCSGIDCAVTPDVGRSIITFKVSNIPGKEHGVIISGSSGTLDASTPTITVTGSGLWASTAQITSVQLDVGSGGGTIDAGSFMTIEDD